MTRFQNFSLNVHWNHKLYF